MYSVGISNHSRALLLLGGFVCLTIVVALGAPRLWAPALIAAGFVLYGGVSALLATGDADPGDHPRAFAYASLATACAALASVGSASVIGRYGGREPHRLDVDEGRLARAASALIVAGCLGIVLVFVRLAISGHTGRGPWADMKSAWEGGGYLLLLANFAVPGFALLLSVRLNRGERAVSTIAVVGIPAVAFVAATAITAQRGFAIELALLVLAVLVGRGMLRAPHLAVLVVVGVALLGVTQAIRNEVRETRRIQPSSVIERLAPDQWLRLYGSQTASFRWTWDVAANRDRLDIPNTFLGLVAKPIPRQLYPGKSQGFGEEFTKRLYPDAAAEGVFFAVPLTAEADYDFGLAGVILVFAVFGVAFAVAELLIVRRAPAILAPLWAASILRSAFLFIRGDLANAATFSAGLLVPLAAASIFAGFRPRSRRNRLVVDALQVAADFSGVGRQVFAMGRSLGDRALGVPLEVRCVEEVLPMLRAAYPEGTTFRVPLATSRPRSLRIAYQQVIAPLLDARNSVVLCTGDQAPAWGRAKVVLVLHDVRRLVQPKTASRIERLFYRTVVARGMRRARKIVTVSEFSASEIRRTFGHDLPLTVVYHHEQVARSVSERMPMETSSCASERCGTTRVEKR